MTESVDLYDSTYGDFAAEARASVRLEPYGEDLGQTGWLTLDELQRFQEWINLAPGSRVLEIGCGSGGLARNLAHTRGVRISGWMSALMP